jgi:PIN domain nuclease of toxin-antitoxin system
VRLLLDSHAQLWSIYEPENLSGRVVELMQDSRNELFLSHASLWEIANMAAFHRLPLVGTSISTMLFRVAQMGVILLPVIESEILAAAALPLLHADPFDRMLVAQAQAHGLTLVTKDSRIRQYDVPAIW